MQRGLLMLPMLAVTTIRAVHLRRASETVPDVDAVRIVTTVSDGLAAFGGILSEFEGARPWLVWLAVALAAASGALMEVLAFVPVVKKVPPAVQKLTYAALLVGTVTAAAVVAHVDESYWALLTIPPPFLALLREVFPETLVRLKEFSSEPPKASFAMPAPSVRQFTPQRPSAGLMRPRLSREQRLNSYL